eukprot:tig00021244_g19567.t1
MSVGVAGASRRPGRSRRTLRLAAFSLSILLATVLAAPADAFSTSIAVTTTSGSTAHSGTATISFRAPQTGTYRVEFNSPPVWDDAICKAPVVCIGALPPAVNVVATSTTEDTVVTVTGFSRGYDSLKNTATGKVDVNDIRTYNVTISMGSSISATKAFAVPASRPQPSLATPVQVPGGGGTGGINVELQLDPNADQGTDAPPSIIRDVHAHV